MLLRNASNTLIGNDSPRVRTVILMPSTLIIQRVCNIRKVNGIEHNWDRVCDNHIRLSSVHSLLSALGIPLGNFLMYL